MKAVDIFLSLMVQGQISVLLLHPIKHFLISVEYV